MVPKRGRMRRFTYTNVNVWLARPVNKKLNNDTHNLFFLTSHKLNFVYSSFKGPAIYKIHFANVF